MISRKVEYMKIAAALCDFHIGEKELDLLVGVYELVMEKGGSATLEDVVGVKVGVDKRHNPQPLVKRGSKKK